jgi:peptidoglycan/LPS O-acetylase OafA/YrhL
MARMESRDNSIGFLRFLFAFNVLWIHGIELGGFAHLGGFYTWAKKYTFLLPVEGFFFLSGFLIAQSFMRSKAWGDFIAARVLRIMPGYYACLAFVAFVIGPIAAWLQRGSFGGYFSAADSPIDYLVKNSLLWPRQRGIADLFVDNPLPIAVNGSLWTLPWEAVGYIAVFLAGVLGVLARRRVVVLAVTLALMGLWVAWAYRWIEPRTDNRILALVNDPLVVRMLMFFAIGMTAFLYREHVRFSKGLFVVALVGAMVGLHLPGGHVLLPVAYAYTVLWLSFNGPFRSFDRKADLSYGIYVYAFPVQQTLALAGVPRFGLLPYVLSTALIVLPLAWLSWTLIEKPALRLKKVFKGRKAEAPQESLVLRDAQS